MFRTIFLTILLTVCLAVSAFGMQKEKEVKPDRVAVVLAAFGTTHPGALKAILNVRSRVAQAFPDYPVRLAFTSHFVRGTWKKRASDPEYANNPEIPGEVFGIRNAMATVSNLIDEGYNVVAVQSLHLFAGEEYADLKDMVDNLNRIRTVKAKNRPFRAIFTGRPVMGEPGIVRPYRQDLIVAAKAAREHVELAEKNDAVLIYMSHGNEYYSTGVFQEFEAVMRGEYPKTPVFVGVVEGFPGLDEVVGGLENYKGKRKSAVIVPLMLVAGDHAAKDLCGGDESWEQAVKKTGFGTTCMLKGLGESNAWANIFVTHLKEALEDNGYLKPAAR